MASKEIICAFGADIDSVAGWIGSYGGGDSPSDIQRGIFASEVGVPRLLNLLYVNKWSRLEIGRTRYGLMCAEVALAFRHAARANPGHELLDWECDWQAAFDQRYAWLREHDTFGLLARVTAVLDSRWGCDDDEGHHR